LAYRPITPALLVDELAELAYRLRPDGRAVLAVDGAPAAAPGELADAVADALADRGRAVRRVSAEDFLRPASVRLERGREDPDSYYEDWLDEAALRREVLDPLAAGGPVLPRLWNPVTDRSYRAERVMLAAPGVLVLDGPLLLGRGLRLDLVAHLAVSPAALARRTPAALAWTLPAFARYVDEVTPELVADVVVRYDHPAHPAVRTSAAAAG
jgi:hypothetical protein